MRIPTLEQTRSYFQSFGYALHLVEDDLWASTYPCGRWELDHIERHGCRCSPYSSLRELWLDWAESAADQLASEQRMAEVARRYNVADRFERSLIEAWADDSFRGHQWEPEFEQIARQFPKTPIRHLPRTWRQMRAEYLRLGYERETKRRQLSRHLVDLACAELSQVIGSLKPATAARPRL